MIDLELLLDETKHKYLSEELFYRNAADLYADFLALAHKLGIKKEDKLKIEKMARQLSVDDAVAAQSGDNTLTQFLSLYLSIPNLADKKAPRAHDSSGNVIIKEKNSSPLRVNKAKSYLELGDIHGFFNKPSSDTICGDGLTILFGQAPAFERALINTMANHHLDNGYPEISPPTAVHGSSMMMSGSFPSRYKDCYRIEGTDWYLNPTIEMQNVNLVRGRKFKEENDHTLFRTFGYARSFRKERGKQMDTYFTLHEFGKVECFRTTTATGWEAALDVMCQEVEELLNKLELPWRKVALASGDLGMCPSLIYDYEVFAPGSNQWLEISSAGYTSDYQTRRLDCTYVDRAGTVRYAHIINVPGFSIPRIICALMENHQDETGAIHIPAAMQPYMRENSKLILPPSQSSAPVKDIAIATY